MKQKLNSDRIQYIFQNMDDAVCMTRMTGEIFFANPSAEKLFGIELREEVKIWEAIPYVEGNDELIQLFIDGVMEKKKSIRSLVDYVNNEGKVYHLHVSLTCDGGEQGGFLIVISDLTNLQKVQSAFARYTSPEIADYVLSDPEGEKQGGQERDVSILMSDLRGFTAMSAQLSSNELIIVLNHYFKHMSAVIRRFRGTVIEFLGDGIFVVFGAPGDLPDHTEAAVACAVEMQNEMAEVNRWNRENGYPMLEMGIGINTGKAVVGNIGSEDKMKYGCMGETVNLAGRTESLTVGGEVLITENTRSRITGRIMINGERKMKLKGVGREISVYDVAGIGDSHVLKETEKEIRWNDITPAKELLFYMLRGKTVETADHTGRLTRISEDEKYGILAAEDTPEALTNLMLRIEGHDIYAKVLQEEDSGCRLRFTSRDVSIISLIG